MRLATHMTHREPLYRVADRLHPGRAVHVPGHEIAHVVSAWLAELGADSPLVNELARAACVGDWAAAHAVGDQLSVDVAVINPNWPKVPFPRAVGLSHQRM